MDVRVLVLFACHASLTAVLPVMGNPVWRVALILRLLLVSWPPQGSASAGALQAWRVAEARAPVPPGAPFLLRSLWPRAVGAFYCG